MPRQRFYKLSSWFIRCCISGTERDDLPKYVETKSVEPRDTIPPSDESLDLVGGEKIQPDIHTLVRNYDKKNLDRTGISRDSLVGMKEGVPGTYSGFQRAEKSYSKLDRKGGFQKSIITLEFLRMFHLIFWV